MINSSLAKRYARALLDIGTEAGAVQEFAAQLGAFVDLLRQDARLKAVFEGRQVSPREKRAIFSEAFKGSMSDTVADFIMLLIDKRREPYLEDIYHEFTGLVDQLEGVMEVRVESAGDLSDSDRESIARELGELTGRKVRVVAAANPRLLGGVTLQIGDKLIDGSVRTRLHELQKRLEGRMSSREDGPAGPQG